MAMYCKSSISLFDFFAVLVLRVTDCRPYTHFESVKFFHLLVSTVTI